MKETKQTQLEAFVWPEFNTDKQRIKAYSKRFKDMTIAEAFAANYDGITLNKVSENVNFVPTETKVGDSIYLNILSISKNNVVFDASNYKVQINSAVNLHKYERFKHNLPTEPVKALIMDVNTQSMTVDPIAPIVNDYLNPILTNKNIQKVVGNPMSVRVKDLQLTKGGFTGKAVLPTVSKFVGEEYTVDVFIPGSQIVLNITDNFEQFVGKEVDAFIINYIEKPGSNTLSLIASAKELIKFKGECKLIELFKGWCEESKAWKEFEQTEIDGVVTGVINSSKKCGVFVELPSLNMTGLVPIDADKLVNYKVDSKVKVKLTGFDEERKYNAITKQLEHVEPYVIEDGILQRCNLKPVLTFVD